MLIRLIRSLTKIRVGLGRFHILVRGPLGINGSLVLAKYCSLYGCFVNRLCLKTHPLISLECLCL